MPSMDAAKKLIGEVIDEIGENTEAGPTHLIVSCHFGTSYRFSETVKQVVMDRNVEGMDSGPWMTRETLLFC